MLSEPFGVARAACFELSAIVYADNDAVLTDYTNNLKIDSTTGGICISASYAAPAAGSSIPKGLASLAAVAVLEVSLPPQKKQLVRLLAKTRLRGIDFTRNCTDFGYRLGLNSAKVA